MTTVLEGGEGSASCPGRSLPPGKTRFPLYRRLGRPQDRYGQVRKISPRRDSTPGPSSPYPVAIPTTRPGPLTSMDFRLISTALQTWKFLESENVKTVVHSYAQFSISAGTAPRSLNLSCLTFWRWNYFFNFSTLCI